MSAAGGSRLTRRGAFVGGASIAGAAALTACSGSSSKTTSSAASSPTPTGTASPLPYVGDSRVVATVAALEHLAVMTYDLVESMAGAGHLGAVPPAVSSYLTKVRNHHADHANAWNLVLTDARQPALTTAPLSIATVMSTAVKASTTVEQALKIILSLEQLAAETCLLTAGTVTEAAAISAAATIAPVEAQHAAILSFMLGAQPVPAAFLATDLALRPTALTG